MNLRGAALAVALLLTVSGVGSARLAAHDMGTTRVDLRVGADGAVRAEILVDPEALVRRLDLAAGRLPAAGGTNEVARLLAARETFVASVDLRAAGQPVPLSFSYAAGPTTASAMTGTVVLTGQMPAGTRAFTWRYRLPLGSYALRVLQPGIAPEQVIWLVGDRTSDPVVLAADAPAVAAVAAQYVVLGTLHIVPRGLDHILFVLCLFLLSPSWRALLTQVSAFTAAHSVTLGASALGLIHAPPGLVEPLIAASIAWVALENVWRPRLSKARLAVVFLFGLLHGLGFAGVLAELGLPAAARVPALLAFNVGVEIGQLSVLAVAFAATAVLLRHPARYRRWVVVPASCAIACVGVYWTVARLIAA